MCCPDAQTPFGCPNTPHRVLPFMPRSITWPSFWSRLPLRGLRKPSDCPPPLAANLGLNRLPLSHWREWVSHAPGQDCESCCGPKPWFGTQARPPSSSLSSSVQSGRFSRLATNPEPHRTPYRRAGTRRPLSRATWVSMDEPCIAQGEVM